MRERMIELVQEAVGGCSKHWAELIVDKLIEHGAALGKSTCLYRGEVTHNKTGDPALDCVAGNLVVEQSSGRCFIADIARFDESTKLVDVLIEVDRNTIEVL